MKKINKSTSLLQKILKQPEEVIDTMDLIYLKSEQLSIARKREGKKFQYALNGKLINVKSQLNRIDKLVIPPAWEDVKIAHLPNGHLQAIGYDLKNRKQYRYHPTWNSIRNQTKFYKMGIFGRQLPKIRRVVENDLAQSGWPKSKVMALIIRLMEETHIRIGNEQYAKRNSTYGLSTLRSRHIKTFKDKIKFQFIGKRGKEHNITLRNKKLMRLVNRCEEIPGWELFKFYDENGNKQVVESGMVNEYIHGICGELFTAKDFRTWAASLVFFESLQAMKAPKTEKRIQKNILSAFDQAAKELGNTRNVCRKYYVHPALVENYEDNLLSTSFKLTNAVQDKDYFSSSEIAILKIYDEYTPDFMTAKNK